MGDLKALLDICVVNKFGKGYFEFERTLQSLGAMAHGLLVTSQSIVIRRFDFLPSKPDKTSPNDLLSSWGMLRGGFFLIE